MLRTTQTENKIYGPFGPMDGPIDNHHRQADMQISRHYHNKEVSVSCHDVNPFYAAAAAGGKVPNMLWDPDPSSPHPAESYDLMHTFETRASGSLPHELSMLGRRKESGSGQCLPHTAPAHPSQQTYKYSTKPSAMSVHRSSSSNSPCTPSHEQNDTLSSSPDLKRTSSMSEHTMSYQHSWSHHSPESCGIQAPHGRPIFPRSSQFMFRHEAMPSFTDVSSGEDKITAGMFQLPVRYRSNEDSHAPTSSLSASSTRPLPSQMYSDRSTPAPLSTPSQAQSQPILRSQNPEILQDIPWHPVSVPPPVYQFSTAEASTRGSPVWWAESHITNNDLPHFSQNGFSHINMAPIEHQDQGQGHQTTDSLSHTFQDNSMMIPMAQSPETMPVSEPRVAPSPVPSPTSLGHTQYLRSSERVYESLPQSPYFENAHAPRAELQHHGLSVPQIEAPRRSSTGAIQRPSRVRTSSTAPHRRRARSRKQSTTSSASTSGRGTKGVTNAHPTNNSNSIDDNGNGGSGGSPICVEFVNFTAEHSHKLLSGVAPSGSSKTKARREQEAREKHRRTLMAVRRAGGEEAVAAVEAALY